MKKRWLSLVLLFLLLGINFSSAAAQNYRFQLASETVNVVVNTDGTESIEYTFDFVNDANASAIDYVDVGVPNSNYDIGSVGAQAGGAAITDISESQYVKPGVALGLGANAIPPGAHGRVHVLIGKVSKVLYPATEQESEKYASIEFSPTWFDSQYCYGQTNMTVTLFLPPGIKENEPKYHVPKSWPGSQDPQSGYDDQGRVFYKWQSGNADGYTQYTFGASFPARLVPSSSIVVAPLINIAPEDLCCWGFFILIFGFVGLMIYLGTVGARKRKLAYLPPKISIEGNGIKRGLTAVEAAILMEEPLDKVLTMILFSVIKKGGATVITRTPLKLKVTDPLPAGLQPYEVDFLKAFQKDNLLDQRKALQTMMVSTVTALTDKMRGFSRKDTVAYYQDIIKRAWDQVEAADTPDVKSQRYDQYMDWTMADHDYDGHTRRAFGSGPIFVPIWWGNYDPTFRPSTTSTISTPSMGTGNRPSVSMPSLPGSDFAASVVNGVQTFSAGVLGDITGFTNGVTNVTNPPPPPSTSSYHGGGGGGHCACACACAGCACACAGGGR